MFLIVHLNETMGKPAFYNYLGCCIDHLRLSVCLECAALVAAFAGFSLSVWE